MPLLSRRISNLPMLNAANRPAISQGDVFMNQTLFTTNGAGRRQALFVTDGATNNDSWGRQTLFSTLPVDAVEEMNVMANAFSAEYGATNGGVINIVTKSGGNNFHGDVLELWRPADTAAALSGFTASQCNQRQPVDQRFAGPIRRVLRRAAIQQDALLRHGRIQPRG